MKSKDTGNCKRHLQRSHRKAYAEFLKLRRVKNTSKSTIRSPSAKQQLTISQSLAMSKSYPADDKRQKEINAAWARAFASNSLPYSLIDDRLFRNALNTMNHRFTPPSRNGMRDLVAAQAEQLKDIMRQVLSNASKVLLLFQ